MTLWEFAQAMAGYTEAHGGAAKPPPMAEAEHLELMAKYA